VGHLFIPELTEPADALNVEKSVHMANPQTKLNWTSGEDVTRALANALHKDKWNVDGRLIPWSFRGLVQVARHLNGEQTRIVVHDVEVHATSDLENVDSQDLISILTDEICAKYF
jgi:hypothetical protein